MKKSLSYCYTQMEVGSQCDPHQYTDISYQYFLKHDLDMLQAVRIPPYHSWKNPVERVNCVLNLGLQSVGLMRASMSDEYETKIKSCKCVKGIRTMAQNDPNFKECFLDTLEPIKVPCYLLFPEIAAQE